MYSTACVLGFSPQKLYITLFRRICYNLFTLLQRQRMFKPVAISVTHIIHAHRCDSFQTRVNLCRTDSETSASTNTDYSDTITVNKRTCTQKIGCSTKILRIHFGQNSIARLTFTPTPKRQINRQRYKTTFSHLSSIQVRALFFDCSHRMSDNNGRIFLSLFHVLWQKQVTNYFHLILIRKRNLFHIYQITFIKVIRINLCERQICSKHHNKYSR